MKDKKISFACSFLNSSSCWCSRNVFMQHEHLVWRHRHGVWAWHEAWACSMDKQPRDMDMKHGNAACTCSISIQKWHAKWTCMWKSSMNKQHGQVAYTCSMDNGQSACSIEMQHGHWTCSMDLQHGLLYGTCSIDQQHGNVAWRHGHAAWTTYHMDKQHETSFSYLSPVRVYLEVSEIQTHEETLRAFQRKEFFYIWKSSHFC